MGFLNSLFGKPPLHKATEEGQEILVRQLLTDGANVNEKHSDGSTALHYGAQMGHCAIVELLVANGADVDCQDEAGVTPLGVAAINNQAKIVRILVDNGANVRLPNKNGGTPVDAAIAKGNLEITEFLVSKGANISVTTKGDITNLHVAVLGGNLDVVRLLIQHGANVNAYTEEGFTPLSLAAQYGHGEIASFLIASGAEVNLSRNGVVSPLIWATVNGITEVVKKLISSGADVDFRDEKGCTALYYASVYCHPDIADILIKSGANVNLVDKNSIGPLYAAAEQGSMEIVKMLVANGGNFLHCSEQNWGRSATPASMARQEGHRDVADYLYGLEKEIKSDMTWKEKMWLSEGELEKKLEDFILRKKHLLNTPEKKQDIDAATNKHETGKTLSNTDSKSLYSKENYRTNYSRAFDIAALDTVLAGLMAVCLVILYSWATKEGNTFSEETWINPLVFGVRSRAFVLGGLIGGVFASIIRPSWNTITTAICCICIWSVLEVADFSPIYTCIVAALLFGVVSFYTNVSVEPRQYYENRISTGNGNTEGIINEGDHLKKDLIRLCREETGAIKVLHRENPYTPFSCDEFSDMKSALSFAEGKSLELGAEYVLDQEESNIQTMSGIDSRDRKIASTSSTETDESIIDFKNCSHCQTKGILPMKGNICPNCKQPL